MAKIFEFHCREEPDECAPSAGHEGVSAEVIVFPGVRYGRREQADGEDIKTCAENECVETGERDRLELVD
jgi:hypothetical protein